MYRTFLSWRYLRARRTNLIGISGILVGVAALILILSIMAGFLSESRATLRRGLSDLVVQPLPFRAADGTLGGQAAEPVLEVVSADPRVAAAAPHLLWGGILTQEGRDSWKVSWSFTMDEAGPFVQLVGVDPELEFETTGLGTALREVSPDLHGFLVEDPEHPFEPWSDYRGDAPFPWVVVGEQLAYRHQLHRGSELKIVTVVPDEDGEIVQSDRYFLVAGTFRTGENDVDNARIYLDRRELASFLGNTREFTQVLVKLEDYERDSAGVRADLTAALLDADLIRETDLGLQIRTWEQFRQNLLGAIENEKTLLGIMLSLVLIVAGFTVFAILSMLVTEKRRDIGILTALGATPRGILVLYLSIGFWDALLGSTVGAAIGVAGALNIDAIERKLSDLLNVQIFDRTVYLFDHIPAVVDPVGVVLIVIGAFACTLVFAALPAWRASRLHPIDALRYE